jgi:replicative DNA helicase
MSLAQIFRSITFVLEKSLDKKLDQRPTETQAIAAIEQASKYLAKILRTSTVPSHRLVLKALHAPRDIVGFRDLYLNIPGREAEIVFIDEALREKPLHGKALENLLAQESESLAHAELADVVQIINSDKNKKGEHISFLERLEKAQLKLADIADKLEDEDSQDYVSSSDPDSLDRVLDSLIAGNSRSAFTYEGLVPLEEGLGFLYNKSLNFIAAPAGSFKTTLALLMGWYAIRNGQSVYYVTTEQGSDEIYKSFLIHLLNSEMDWMGSKYEKLIGTINHHNFEEKMADPSVRGFLREANASFGKPTPGQSEPLGHLIIKTVGASVGGTVEAIRLDAENEDKKLKRDGKFLGLVIIDYLGVLDVPVELARLATTDKIRHIASEAKKMALNFAGRGIVVLTPHQLNREGQKRIDAKKTDKPRAYDLSDSAWIERYADSIVCLHRNDQDKISNRVQVSTLKSRRSGDILPFVCQIDHGMKVITSCADASILFDESITPINLRESNDAEISTYTNEGGI